MASVRYSSTHTLPSDWLAQLRQRVGKCILFGLSERQIDEAGHIMKLISTEWHQIVAGSEGFWTRGNGRSLYTNEAITHGIPPYQVSRKICQTKIELRRIDPSRIDVPAGS